MKENTTIKEYQITAKQRQAKNGHRSFTVWFTGLSGSGKSTLANAVEQALFHEGIRTYTIDGDNMRNGLNCDLGFSQNDRDENIRRVAELATLMIDAGLIVLAAFISPTKASRNRAKEIIGADNFIEIFVNTSLEICEKRDVKGLYKKARSGAIKNMTGISAPYEIPEQPDLNLDTENQNIQASANQVLKLIEKKLQL